MPNCSWSQPILATCAQISRPFPGGGVPDGDLSDPALPRLAPGGCALAQAGRQADRWAAERVGGHRPSTFPSTNAATWWNAASPSSSSSAPSQPGSTKPGACTAPNRSSSIRPSTRSCDSHSIPVRVLARCGDGDDGNTTAGDLVMLQEWHQTPAGDCGDQAASPLGLDPGPRGLRRARPRAHPRGRGAMSTSCWKPPATRSW